MVVVVTADVMKDQLVCAKCDDEQNLKHCADVAFCQTGEVNYFSRLFCSGKKWFPLYGLSFILESGFS